MARKPSPPVITILEDVERCEKDALETIFAQPEGGEIKVVINSGGGSVYAAMGMATAIRMRRLKATALVLADCSSSALLIFAACDRRLVARHASFLFHPMQWSSGERSRLCAARSWSQEFSRVNQACEQFLCEQMPLDLPTLRRWSNQERYVLAADLVERGLATYIDVPAPAIVPIAPRRRAAGRKGVHRTAAKIRRVG